MTSKVAEVVDVDNYFVKIGDNILSLAVGYTK